MIPYMVGKPASSATHSIRGLVKYVLSRGYFRAVSSQNRKIVIFTPYTLLRGCLVEERTHHVALLAQCLRVQGATRVLAGGGSSLRIPIMHHRTRTRTRIRIRCCLALFGTACSLPTPQRSALLRRVSVADLPLLPGTSKLTRLMAVRSVPSPPPEAIAACLRSQ